MKKNIAIGLISQLLSRSDIYSVIADSDGRIAGSNFLRENTTIAVVGPITVDSAVQNGAIGKQLMEQVLRRVRKTRFPGIRMGQAEYHNRSLSLYVKLGVHAREPLSTLQGRALGMAV